MLSLLPIFTAKAGLGTTPSKAGKPVKGCLGPIHSSGSIVVVVSSTASVVVVTAMTEVVASESVGEDEEVVVALTVVFSLPPHAENRINKTQITHLGGVR